MAEPNEEAAPERGLRTGFVAGAAITPSAMEIDKAFRMAALADQLGYEMVAVQDHPYNAQFVDTWTLLTAMALYTQRVHLATDVANLGVRPPAMLLKAAATLQMLSGGRVILGVGGGVSAGAVSGFGGLRVESARELGDAFAEALEILQRLQAAQGRSVTFAGKHHTLRNAQFGPALSIHTPIWTGAMKPRGLRLTGQFADGWFIPLNSYVADAELPALQKQVDDAAIAAGRDPRAIRRVRNLSGFITPEGSAPRSAKGALVGPVSHWIESLTRAVTELGVDGVVFWPMQEQEQQIAEFAELVLPDVRAAWESR
jgi:alkanesulfonate monooxygenase SsuD/methylene tetrahydromethanopterin reductase-like flavin-dependent oxidoreductase (luciferase family)